MPGTVVDVRIATGDEVTQGDILVTIDAMKMEHAVRAPHPGTVTAVNIAAGDQVAAGQILVVISEP